MRLFYFSYRAYKNKRSALSFFMVWIFSSTHPRYLIEAPNCRLVVDPEDLCRGRAAIPYPGGLIGFGVEVPVPNHHHPDSKVEEGLVGLEVVVEMKVEATVVLEVVGMKMEGATLLV